MMNKKILFLLIFITLIFTITSTTYAENLTNTINETNEQNNNIHIVNGSSINQMDDNTIQQAIDNAKEGDTIQITGTNYVHCHIIINKPLKIISEVGTTMSPCPSDKKGSGSVGVFYLTPEAKNTIIQGFTINNNLEDDSYTVPPYGIYSNGAENITITNCNINSKYGEGIIIKNGKTIKIINNTLINSINGINIINTTNTIIENNNISSNSLSGVKISEKVNNTTIISNTISQNIYGINASSSDDLYILNNQIFYNRNANTQDRATMGAGVYTNSNITNTIIRGNFIYENGMYGIYNDYRTRNLKNENIQIVDQNYFGSHKQRAIFTGIYVPYENGDYDYDEETDTIYEVERNTGHYTTGTGMIFIWSNIFYSEYFCGGTSYAPGVLRSTNPYKDLIVGNITEIEPGLYTYSFNYKPGYMNGSKATEVNAIDMIFYLNKNNTSINPIEGDIYRKVTMKDGIAIADFRNETYLPSGNNVSIIGPGSGSFTGGNRPYAFLSVTNIPTNETNTETKIIQEDLIKTYSSKEEFTGKLVDGNNNPFIGRTVNLKLTRISSGANKVYQTTTDYTGTYHLTIGLAPGDYTVEATFKGDDTYKESTAKSNIKITEDNLEGTILTANKINKSYGEDGNLTGTLTDANKNPLPGQYISITLTRLSNGASKTYSTTTDYTGAYNFVINLGQGEYRANCSYDGIEKYSSSSTSTTITITDAKIN